MTYRYNPAPTYAEVVIRKVGSNKPEDYTFNPIWLKWFVDLSANMVFFQNGVNNIAVTTINNVSITKPVVTAVLTLASGKTFTISNTIALTGTDGVTITFPTTSATMARTDAGQTFTGNQQINGAFGCNSKVPQTPYVSGGAAPPGGVGTAAGGYDTAANRDAAITLLNNIRLALVANGIMS